MTSEQALTVTEIRELRSRLEAEHRALRTDYERALAHEREIPVGETGDLADRAETGWDREETLATAESDLERLRRIEAALRRISDGTYGICIAGGETIPSDRLRAVPWAERCAAHQEQLDAHALAGRGWRNWGGGSRRRLEVPR
jgi:DnaK suppressor protein